MQFDCSNRTSAGLKKNYSKRKLIPSNLGINSLVNWSSFQSQLLLRFNVNMKKVLRQSRSAAVLIWNITSTSVGSVSNQTTIFKGRSTTYPALPLHLQHLSQLNQWHLKERQLKHLDQVWKNCQADTDRIWISPIGRAKTIVNIIFIPLELYFKIYFKQKVYNQFIFHLNYYFLIQKYASL